MFIGGKKKNVQLYKLVLLAHKDGDQNDPLPKRSIIKMARFQKGPRARKHTLM